MKHILVIRRDNIGDLVCTTPLLSALRRNFPAVNLAVLVNSYNAPVLAGNADIDQTVVYRKTKHRESNETRIGVWWRTLLTLRQLRATTWDAVFLATTAYSQSADRFARSLKSIRTLGYGGAGSALTHALPQEEAVLGHECEAVMRLLQPLGIHEQPGLVKVFASREEQSLLRSHIPAKAGGLLTVGFHLSARKPLQRWPVEKFVGLAQRIAHHYNARILLFWSPGGEDHPLHPGDDAKAREFIESAQPLSVIPCPTQRLEQLIAGLSLCDSIVCSDGGAMHLAAGLGKPILAFFGNSSVERWHPWGVPYRALQKESAIVADITVCEAWDAYCQLMS